MSGLSVTSLFAALGRKFDMPTKRQRAQNRIIDFANAASATLEKNGFQGFISDGYRFDGRREFSKAEQGGGKTYVTLLPRTDAEGLDNYNVIYNGRDLFKIASLVEFCRGTKAQSVDVFFAKLQPAPPVFSPVFQGERPATELG